jgi:hypothetical protein
MQNYQTGYQHSLQMQPQQLQQPTTGTQMQLTPYNKQIPMLVNNPLLANQPTDYTYNHQNATSNNSQSFIGQKFANPYTPTAYASLNGDEELDVNTTDHSNKNLWQAVKKRKNATIKLLMRKASGWTQATNIKNFMLKRIQDWKKTHISKPFPEQVISKLKNLNRHQSISMESQITEQ